MKVIKQNYILILIVLLALFLRVVFLNSSPPSLNWDETSLGYNAYSILKTGKDEWGRTLPLTFEAFGDYKLPGYIYILVPFIAVFGLSEMVIKMPSILAGTFSVLLIYLITSKLFKQRILALIAGLLFAISPWSIFLSRIALEANLALIFFLLGFYFLLVGLEKNSKLIWATIFLGLTVFTYNSARVFVPIFLLSFIFVFWKKLWVIREKLIIPAVILGGIILSAFFLAVFQDSSSRYYWVSILDEGAINYLNESRGTSGLPEIITKLIYNKPVYFVITFFVNYLSHFSLQYLFINGGSNYQFSLPNIGLLYLIEFPFLLYGIIKLVKGDSWGRLLVVWLLIAPIPAAITRESPHALRSIFMLGVLQIIIAVGLYETQKKVISYLRVLKNVWVALILVVYLFSLTFYMQKYLFTYPKQYSQSWQYGYKQIFSEELDTSKPIYITKKYGEPHIFYLFHTRYDPLNYQNNPSLVRYAMTNWRWVDRLDNLYFINDWEVKEKMKDKKDVLLITSPDNYPEGGKKLKTINFLDGKGAFDIVQL